MDDTTDSSFLSEADLAMLLPGYRLDPEPVATTGMSRVYLATDSKLHHRKVAIKIMADYLAVHPGYRKRFLREIQLMASLEHPNIIYVITASKPDDRLLYLAMPRAEGDLRAQLADGPLDLAKTVHVVKQIAKALDFAHDHGVVHRDVKPGNILFGPDEHVYLCDFGVAKEHFGENLTRAGESIGTRRYTAPEVFATGASDAAEGDAPPAARLAAATPYERAGDVYSLGAVLYHCLTGKRPFDQLDEPTAEAAQLAGAVPMPSELRPKLPRTLDDVVAKAMSLDPSARYGTCGELADALAAAVGLTGEGTALPVLRDILERLPSRAGEPGRRPRSPEGAAGPTRAWPVGALTTLVALLMLAGSLLFMFFDREPDASADDLAQVDSAESATTSIEEVSPTGLETTGPPPVTGEDRVNRYPVEGECLDGSPDAYWVVSCDSAQAKELVYNIVTDPEDPNPSQPDHEDAAWKACGDEGFDFEYIWRDSATAENPDREWNPETDSIHWIMCYRKL